MVPTIKTPLIGISFPTLCGLLRCNADNKSV